MLYINEIKNKYNAGDYTYKVSIPAKVSADHVFDEDLSVKRNREFAAEHNEKIEQMWRDKDKRQRELDQQLTNDVVEYIMAYYGLTEQQAKHVENFTYQEKHSFMCDYFSYIDTYADFAFMLLPPKEETND